jgi:hypothetical protein
MSDPKLNANEADSRIVLVGADKVAVSADRVVIYAVNPMDWPVREFHRVPIFFDGGKFYLRTKSAETTPPFVMRYELWLWPANLHEESSEKITYDGGYVDNRDEAARRNRVENIWHTILLPFYPLLGFCWSNFKQGWLQRIGFDPRETTSISIFVGFTLLFSEAVFVGWLQRGLVTVFFDSARYIPVDMALLLLLMADTVLRYGRLLDLDNQTHWGFGEWLWPRRRKNNA